MSEQQLPGGVSAAQLTAWKQRYGDVFRVNVPLDDEGERTAHVYLKRPSLEAIGASQQYVETDPVQSAQVVYNDAVLGGDTEIIQENDEAKISLFQQLNHLFKVRVAELEKL